MAAAAGLYAVAAGNIGPNAVAELSKAEAAGALPDIWVLEPRASAGNNAYAQLYVSCPLNITEDHLDWHGSIEAYAHAKGRILHPIPYASSIVKIRSSWLNLKKWMIVSTQRLDASHSARRSRRKRGELGLMMAAHASQGYWLGLRDQMEVDVLFLPEFELLIRGRHNAMNALRSFGTYYRRRH